MTGQIAQLPSHANEQSVCREAEPPAARVLESAPNSLRDDGLRPADARPRNIDAAEGRPGMPQTDGCPASVELPRRCERDYSSRIPTVVSMLISKAAMR